MDTPSRTLALIVSVRSDALEVVVPRLDPGAAARPLRFASEPHRRSTTCVSAASSGPAMSKNTIGRVMNVYLGKVIESANAGVRSEMAAGLYTQTLVLALEELLFQGLPPLVQNPLVRHAGLRLQPLEVVTPPVVCPSCTP